MTWYKIVAPDTHQARGEEGVQTIYLWADDIDHASRRYGWLSGVKRDKAPNSVEELGRFKQAKLEAAIMQMGFKIEDTKRKYLRFDSRGEDQPPV